MQPRVYVIILNWNGLTDTIECLESLKKITYPNYQVLVIDNASDGSDVRVLREKFGDYAPVLKNRYNCGFQKGSNIGMQLAIADGTDYVLLLNNDTVVEPDFLDKLISVAEKWPEMGILTPTLNDYYPPRDIDPVCAEPMAVDWLRNTCKPIFGTQYDNTLWTQYIVGAAMLIKRSTVEEIGYLSEDYFLAVGDADYCLKAIKANITLMVVTDSVVYHKGGQSIDKGKPKKRLNWSRVWQGYIGWQRLRWRYLSKPMFVVTSIGLLGYWGYRLIRRVV